VHLILATLRAIAAKGSGRVIEELERRWDGMCASAQGAWPLGATSRKQADETFEDLYGPLDEHLSSIRYRSLMPAVRLAKALTDDKAAARCDPAPIPDVLNAAWLCRPDHDDDPGAVAAISSRALDLCRRS
jgi:hypothetical protein